MIISLVVAASENNAIGKNNDLLWHLPNDMKFLKNVTWGLPVCMGRKTFESFKGNPLNGRLNIIITRQKDFNTAGTIVVSGFEEAIRVAAENDYKEMMILGGGEIYKQTIDRADKIYITRVHAVFEDADTFFPAIDESKWKLVSNIDNYKDDRHDYDYSFQLWERK